MQSTHCRLCHMDAADRYLSSPLSIIILPQSYWQTNAYGSTSSTCPKSAKIPRFWAISFSSFRTAVTLCDGAVEVCTPLRYCLLRSRQAAKLQWKLQKGKWTGMQSETTRLKTVTSTNLKPRPSTYDSWRHNKLYRMHVWYDTVIWCQLMLTQQHQKQFCYFDAANRTVALSLISNVKYRWDIFSNHTIATNVMHWILFIRKILLLSSTCFEYQVLIFRRT